MTDTERHDRFVQMAHEVGASDNEADFVRVMDQIVAARPSGSGNS